MKKRILFYGLIVMTILLSSCSSNKRCRGNGSWYGKRNLSLIEKPQQDSSPNYNYHTFQVTYSSSIKADI